jgi:hypothetical protein
MAPAASNTDANYDVVVIGSGVGGYGYIAEKFDTLEGFGPTCVRQFVQDTRILGDRTAEQWQQDAFGQVDAWLRAMELRD